MNKRTISIAIVTATVAAFGAVAVMAAERNDAKYALTSPGGIAFADFKGYEDWATISTAKTDVLKEIVGNPAIIKAFKAGVPGNGQPFRTAPRSRSCSGRPRRAPSATFDVDVPDTFSQAFVMEKDSKRFPNTGGWGYAVFNYDPKTDKFTPDASEPCRLRARVSYVAVKRRTTFSTRTRSVERHAYRTCQPCGSSARAGARAGHGGGVRRLRMSELQAGHGDREAHAGALR